MTTDLLGALAASIARAREDYTPREPALCLGEDAPSYYAAGDPPDLCEEEALPGSDYCQTHDPDAQIDREEERTWKD